MQGKQGNSGGVGSNISETTEIKVGGYNSRENRAHKLEEFEPFGIHPTVRNNPTKHGLI